ncbi:hypothetical protein J4732_18780 [Serratia marcescens]|uniref:Uncharacterized protein n=1 Tax=Serratia marcescens TaxID=615 RepID=A0A939NLK6_SERMA|nr:hypothetical protein [Serratia marcescens]
MIERDAEEATTNGTATTTTGAPHGQSNPDKHHGANHPAVDFQDDAAAQTNRYGTLLAIDAAGSARRCGSRQQGPIDRPVGQPPALS